MGCKPSAIRFLRKSQETATVNTDRNTSTPTYEPSHAGFTIPDRAETDGSRGPTTFGTFNPISFKISNYRPATVVTVPSGDSSLYERDEMDILPTLRSTQEHVNNHAAPDRNSIPGSIDTSHYRAATVEQHPLAKMGSTTFRMSSRF
jgi:hypothetical protein